MSKLTTVKFLRDQIEKLSNRINLLEKRRIEALELARTLQEEIDSLLGGAGVVAAKKPGRKPGPKPGKKRGRKPGPKPGKKAAKKPGPKPKNGRRKKK
jgi:hypothetical protein